MELIFESTKKFEKELAQFQNKEKKKIIEKINSICSLLETKRQNFFKRVYKPLMIKLLNQQDSSLYTLRINKDIRVVLTVDDDPIFDQIIISLLHVVRHDAIKNVYQGIAESLYQYQIDSISDNGNK